MWLCVLFAHHIVVISRKARKKEFLALRRPRRRLNSPLEGWQSEGLTGWILLEARIFYDLILQKDSFQDFAEYLLLIGTNCEI